MDSTILFILVVGGLGMVVLVAWLRSRAIINDNAPNPPDWILGASPESIQMPQSTEMEMRRMLAQGKKIEAIKIVREHTGWGLKESKDYVDAIEAGNQPVATLRQTEAFELSQSEIRDLEREVRQLLAAGQKIDAVKLVREHTGWGLKESKDFVDAIESGGQPVMPLPETGAVVTSHLNENDLEHQVRQLLAARRKIDAVKLVRERTGWGLKESKDYVDRLE